jgi:CelD/BcsL family acetyltransferase involved in cellulose biosynthesis
MISSLAAGEIRKYSPGDYALRAMIKSLCEDGTAVLDFSAGDSAYKTHWADSCIPLYFIVRASTFAGLPGAVYILMREKVKRIAKRTPVLSATLFKLRRIVCSRTS